MATINYVDKTGATKILTLAKSYADSVGTSSNTHATTLFNNLSKELTDNYPKLDTTKKIPSSYLPGYVDDVLEGYYDSSKNQFFPDNTMSSTPLTGESGKIYVDRNTNKTYRYSGSTYVEISSSLALGETSSTAFPGDRGLSLEETRTWYNTWIKPAFDYSNTEADSPLVNIFAIQAIDSNNDPITLGIGNVDYGLVLRTSDRPQWFDGESVKSIATLDDIPTKTNVSISQTLKSGTESASITIDGVSTKIYFTDTKVTQNLVTANADYRVLLSSSADNNNVTDGVKKSSGLTYNPSTKTLSLGSTGIMSLGTLNAQTVKPHELNLQANSFKLTAGGSTYQYTLPLKAGTLALQENIDNHNVVYQIDSYGMPQIIGKDENQVQYNILTTSWENGTVSLGNESNDLYLYGNLDRPKYYASADSTPVDLALITDIPTLSAITETEINTIASQLGMV